MSAAVRLALLCTLVLPGCARQGARHLGDPATQPAAAFHKALRILQNPDRNGWVDYETAGAYFARAADLGGGPKASFNAGWSAERLGDLKAAESHYRAALAADPAYDAAARSLASVLTQLGRDDEAVEVYAAAASAHPEDLPTANAFVGALVRVGDVDQAIARSQVILRADPGNAQAYQNLSALYFGQGNLQMSLLMADKALALAPGDPGLHNNIGLIRLQRDQLPQAIEAFKTAVELDPRHFEANMNLGYTALDSGDFALALGCFEAATAASPADLDAQLGLAIALRGTGDFKAAGRAYDAILEADPSTDAAYLNAAVLHQEFTRDYAAARAYLQAFVDTHAVGPDHAVFQRLAALDAAEAEAAHQKRLADEARAREAARIARNKELMADLAVRIEALEGQLAERGDCLDAESVDQAQLVVEQARFVVDEKELELAPEMDLLLTGWEEGIATALVGCD